MEEIFNRFGSLFEVFGWWTLALIAGTVAIMYPINLLWIKLMKKDNLARLRKLTSFISVYVVALVVVSIFTAIVSVGSFKDFGYLSGSTISLGFLAQVAWEVVKIIRDYGFKKFFVYVSEKVDWKKSLKEFGKQFNIDTKIIDYIADGIETNYLSKVDANEVEVLVENRLSIIDEIKKKLEGFVENEKIEDVAAGVYNMLVDAWNTDKAAKKEEKKEEKKKEELNKEPAKTEETEEVIIIK